MENNLELINKTLNPIINLKPNIKKNEIQIKYSIIESNDVKIFFPEENKKYTIKILGNNFVENNKYNCEILYNNKKYELTEYFEIKLNSNNNNNNNDLSNEYLLIKIISKSPLNNLSYMFDGCKSLIEIIDLKNFEQNNFNNFNHMFCG